MTVEKQPEDPTSRKFLIKGYALKGGYMSFDINEVDIERLYKAISESDESVKEYFTQRTVKKVNLFIGPNQYYEEGTKQPTHTMSVSKKKEENRPTVNRKIEEMKIEEIKTSDDMPF